MKKFIAFIFVVLFAVPCVAEVNQSYVKSAEKYLTLIKKSDEAYEYLLDEMWRVAQSRLFMSMFANRVGHESMAKLLSAISSQQKLIAEGKSAGMSDVDTMRAMQEMLSLVSPKVIDTTAREVDDRLLEEAAVQARMDSEKAVDSVVLDDVGKNGVKLIAEA